MLDTYIVLTVQCKRHNYCKDWSLTALKKYNYCSERIK